jgi:peptidoglycan/LPS O-acetylase OafA/YrhL
VTSPKTQSNYIPTLDGWRAVAILWVMQFHSQMLHIGTFTNQWLHTTGSRGVSLFFALSGFLICTRLLREENRFGSISLKGFYTRRLFRIQPAALTYLAVVAVLTLCGVIPAFWPGIAGSVLMIRNIWPLRITYSAWYTSHFWSLAVEEHFYLLLPGFLLLVKRNRLAILAGTIVVLQIWSRIVFATPRLQDVFSWQTSQRTDVSLGGILLGSIVAVALTHENFRTAAKRFLQPWAAVLYTLVVFFMAARQHSYAALLLTITIYPLLILATVLHPETLLSRLLELAPVRFIGRISYSLYLWQQLFFYGWTNAALGSFHSHIALCWASTFACAIASYYLIETPLIQRGHRIAKTFDLKKVQVAA